MYPAMYQGATQFGFANSQSGVLPSTLDHINPAYYAQIGQFIEERGLQARLSSVIGVRIYDTLRIDAGIMPLKSFNFFANGVNQNQSLFVTTTTSYNKQQIDVSPWVDSGKLAKGYEALIWSVQFQIHTTAAADESLQTTGDFINLTLDPGQVTGQAAAGPHNQANVMRAFQEGIYARLFVNQTNFEDGPLSLFPAGKYGTGGGIALAGTQAAPIGDGVLTNGFGIEYQMPVMRVIPEQTKFGVGITVQNPFTLANVGPVRLVCVLEGIGVQPVTG